jgi:DUF1365 family protein
VSTKSCIYEGHIRHRRFSPVSNQFTYGLFLFYLDLDELPDLFTDRWFFSHERPNLACFRRRDHLGDLSVPLDRAVRDIVQGKTGTRPEGPIRLLTHLRYLGYCFNPLSVYYCYDEDDREPETIVAEVHNTPWGEEHCYVLEQSADIHPSPKWRQFRFDKGFHVSPFMPLDMKYDWRCSNPGEALQIHINSSKGDLRVFDATLSLRRRPISSSSLARLLVTRPPMTYRVITKIYWQALRLWHKGAPYFPHPKTVANGSGE